MNIDQIISRFLSNSASKEELNQLETWKKEAVENAQALKEMQELWSEADELKDYQNFDTDSAWNKLNSQMVDIDLKAPSSNKEISIFRRMLPYAASILLVISAAFFLKDKEFGGNKIESYSSSDQITSHKLSDQSDLSIDRNSVVTVLSDFTKERTVRADGRILFDIAKDTKRPFVVKTHHGDIRVTGTVFSVATNEESTHIFLKEGSIQYIHNNKTIDLKPGEALSIESSGAALVKYDESDPNVLSWVNNELVFQDRYVADVLSSLSTHFGTAINLTNGKIDKKCKVSSRFNDLTLDQILKELGQFLKFEYEMNSEEVVIQHISC